MLKIYPDIDLIKRTDIKKKLLKKDQETFFTNGNYGCIHTAIFNLDWNIQ